MHECYVCGKTGNLQKHHIIHGHGKRKACETRESLIDICYECHRLVHSNKDPNLDKNLKLQLQTIYFEKGYNEDKVRELMGGKVFLCEVRNGDK